MEITYKTYSLSVLASMLEAGTIRCVDVIVRNPLEQETKKVAIHSLTPEQLRNMDRGRHMPARVRETRWEHRVPFDITVAREMPARS